MSKRRNSKKLNKKVDGDISSEISADGCCFICDGPVKKNGVQIVLGRTPYSNVGLPAKIGQLIGDNFMVVVGVADIMCARCASLISHLDKLETDAQTVKQILTGFIASKYQLNHNEICAKSNNSDIECASVSSQQKETVKNISEKYPVQTIGIENKRKSEQVSLLSNKRKKNLSTSCKNCNFCTEDKDALEIHSALCLKQSFEVSSQTKVLSEGDLDLVCLSEESQRSNNQTETKEKIENNYMESLMRVDSLDSDGSNIEFHSCSSCSLTFLNKMLFTEHMKMHSESKHQDNLDMNDPHDVLKSSTASVTGDCSIDDDLEDLFEKLHAETNASIQVVDEKRSCVNGQALSVPSNTGALKSELSDHGTINDMPQMTSKLIDQKEQSALEPDQSSLNSNLESLGFNPFQQSLIHKEKIYNGQLESNLLDSTEQQSYIFISNTLDGLSDCQSQNDMVLHNATLDPNSGSIHLLPFVIDDSVESSHHRSNILQINSSSQNEDELFEQNFCKMKPEPELAQNKLEAVNSELNVLSCDYCSFHTSIELVFKKHLKIHQENLVQKCSICNRVFSSTQRLLTHIDLRHENAGPLKCPSCSQDCNNSLLLREHLAQEHSVGKRNFSCRFCDEMFPSKKSCTSHEESHSEIFKYSCKICLKKFSSEDDLNDHLKWDHDKTGQCRYCGKKIDKPKALKHHELRHMQESNHHQCQECKRIFKTKTGLRHHAANHTGQFKYCCDFCGRGFMSRMMLEEHRSCHTKEERYVCDICGQKFKFQSTYWIHRKWHETPYPYKCSFCGRFFKHSSLLAVHKRKHTGERPYKCPHCPLTFPVSGTLKRHIILHTGMYPFNCDLCKRGFTARHKYASHLQKVHGTKDVSSQESLEDDLKLDITDKDMPNRVKEWAFDADNYQCLSMVDSPGVRNRDPLISDQNIQSRVVEIVLDESYQPVATVTLGGSESIIPETWYD